MCDICRQTPCNYHCPNYVPPKATQYCSICKDGIYDGEEYLKNSNDCFAHYFCIDTIRDAVEWLGYEIKTMEEIDERDY